MASRRDDEHRAGRLKARPGQVTEERAATGLLPLGLDGERDGLLYVPAGYRAEQPAPLALMLHGAGGAARGSTEHFIAAADAAGLLLLAPDSRGMTWDIIARRSYGPDVAFIDRALAQSFARYAIDPRHLAIGGFSDGASYALSLGLANGDLFSHIIAFSPGFMVPPSHHGVPRIYISHGTHDAVLPIARCSRRIAPQLRREGYDVTYREFDGPHTVPIEIALEAWQWFRGEQAGS